MKKVRHMHDARLYSLELVLLGMVLAQDGDRDEILSHIDEKELFSERVGKCIKAVRTRDSGDVASARKAFEGMGLKVGDSVRDELIARVKVTNARRKLQRSLFDVSVSPNGDIESAVDKVNEMADTYKETKRKYENQKPIN